MKSVGSPAIRSTDCYPKAEDDIVYILKRYLVSELDNCQLELRVNSNFCTMNFFTSVCKLRGRRSGYKYPKLDELAYFFGIDNRDIVQLTKKIFDVDNVVFHDSRFDIVTTYLCCVKAMEQRLLDSGILNI